MSLDFTLWFVIITSQVFLNIFSVKFKEKVNQCVRKVALKHLLLQSNVIEASPDMQRSSEKEWYFGNAEKERLGPYSYEEVLCWAMIYFIVVCYWPFDHYVNLHYSFSSFWFVYQSHMQTGTSSFMLFLFWMSYSALSISPVVHYWCFQFHNEMSLTQV